MSTVRTPGAGTEDRDPTTVSANVNRSPVPGLPRLHQIVLPTPWEAGAVQVYLIEGDPLTLIDTGVKCPAARASLEAALDSLGYGINEIQRVILTHFHGDHLGQAQSIREAGDGLEVWAHEAEAPMIEFYTPERDERIEDTEALFREYGVPEDLLQHQVALRRKWLREVPPRCEATTVENVLRDGDRIPFKDFELQTIHTPGHSAGHILLLEEESGTLLSGDHIMGETVPFTDNYYLEGPPDPRDPLGRHPRFKGLLEYLRSVRKLRRQSFDAILPAHGGVIQRADRAIEDALLFYEVRIQQIERGLRTLAAMGHEVTGWEIWKALFPKADPLTRMHRRMQMVIGALDVLEEQGACITTRRADGVLVHQHE
jgi:glyoxylase-like metal-dependent hydrolase (beta-lactamase superfamily II)